MSALLIRPATPADAPALVPLIDGLGYEVAPDEVAARLPDLALCGGSALVGELDGRIVACLTTAITRVIHRPAPVGRISMFVVDESLRGQGIGRQMLDEAVRRLGEAGCQLLEVTSNVRRKDAHAFYEHLGWEPTSLRFSIEIDGSQQAYPNRRNSQPFAVPPALTEGGTGERAQSGRVDRAKPPLPEGYPS